MPKLADTKRWRPASVNGSAQRGGEPVGDRAHGFGVVDRVEQDHELVAAEAGEHVVGAQLGH